MAGDTDLDRLLATLTVSVRPGRFTVVTVSDPVDLDRAEAWVRETEGITVICSVAEAERQGRPVDFVGAWLTLDVHSSLEAVGLTAAVATALAQRNIACNVVAGFHHDHLLVPFDRADEAVAGLLALASND